MSERHQLEEVRETRGRGIGSTNVGFPTNGSLVRRIRVERQLTQAVLSEYSSLSKTMISLIETRNQRLSRASLERLADALELPGEALILRLDIKKLSKETETLVILRALKESLQDSARLVSVLIEQAESSDLK